MDATWVRQELEAVKVELQRINHLRHYNPPMQFFSNEIKTIEDLQRATTDGTWQSQGAKENIWWLAATLCYYDKPWSSYFKKITQAKAQAVVICHRMGGRRAEWMAPSPSWDLN